MELIRSIYENYTAWKEKENRKPLLIDGARQVGKSFSLRSWGTNAGFRKVHFIDFLRNPELERVFETTLAPKTVLERLSLEIESSISTETDLLIFDEIGECPRALTSLKFFCEELPNAFVVATGSNVGAVDWEKSHGSFPVGKVENIQMYPLTFAEYLHAANEFLYQHYRSSSLLTIDLFRKLEPYFYDYLFTGGMPEVVVAWLAEREPGNIPDRIDKVRKLQAQLMMQYANDIKKFFRQRSQVERANALLKAIPSQLQAHYDTKTKRMKFSDIESNKRYRDFEDIIGLLESVSLIHRATIIDNFRNVLKEPLSVIAGKSRSKLRLYLFDIGLCHSLLNFSYKQIIDRTFAYKGLLMENFCVNEFVAQGFSPLYTGQSSTHEMDLLLDSESVGAAPIPVEIKSGNSSHSASLKYFKKIGFETTIKLVGSVGDKSEPHMVRSVLEIPHITKLLLDKR